MNSLNFAGFFKKSSILSGIIEDLFVLWAKSNLENPFQQLWVAKKTNKQALFSRYYLPCHKKLTMYCLAFLKDIELAENAATDTLLKLFEQEKETIEKPERWLFTVAKNRCLSLLSQKKRRREIIDQLKPNLETTAPAKGDQQLAAADIKAKIQSVLNGKEWQIWQLHQEGYNNQEIAARLKITEKTAANTKSIARNKLRQAFAQ
ncbi:MAG TPA: RNA polymerase sigma factor [Saprospiraceae bacterium]|nr:RNA polymerase sigma factor [Saprospiraceae bacterium]